MLCYTVVSFIYALHELSSIFMLVSKYTNDNASLISTVYVISVFNKSKSWLRSWRVKRQLPWIALQTLLLLLSCSASNSLTMTICACNERACLRAWCSVAIMMRWQFTQMSCVYSLHEWIKSGHKKNAMYASTKALLQWHNVTHKRINRYGKCNGNRGAKVFSIRLIYVNRCWWTNCDNNFLCTLIASTMSSKYMINCNIFSSWPYFLQCSSYFDCPFLYGNNNYYYFDKSSASLIFHCAFDRKDWCKFVSRVHNGIITVAIPSTSIMECAMPCVSYTCKPGKLRSEMQSTRSFITSATLYIISGYRHVSPSWHVRCYPNKYSGCVYKLDT